MSSDWKTEEEAKKTWCPQVRAIVGKLNGADISYDGEQPAHNRVAQSNGPHVNPGFTMCCASLCAMWVWAEEGEHRQPGPGIPSVLVDVGGCGLRRLP